MKTLKILMLIAGILAFAFGTYNIIISGLPNQWFGFISGAFFICMYFNIDRIYSINRLGEKLNKAEEK